MFVILARNIPGATGSHIASTVWVAQFIWYNQSGVPVFQSYQQGANVPDTRMVITAVPLPPDPQVWGFGIYNMMCSCWAGVPGYTFSQTPWSAFSFKDGQVFVATFADGYGSFSLIDPTQTFALESTKLAKLILRNPNPVDLACHLKFHVGPQTWESWWTFPANSEDTTTWLLAMSTFGVGTFPVLVEVYDTVGNLLLRQPEPDITVI